LWALFLWFYKWVTNGVPQFRRDASPLPLIFFLILAIFYTFYSIDYAVSRDFLFFLISYFVIFFLVVQISRSKEARWIALTIVILGILTSLYGLYQYFWGFQGLICKIKEAETLPASISPFTDEIIDRLGQGRIFSTFLLPSHFAAFLGISIPVSLAFVLSSKGWIRYLFGLAVALQLFALYLTKSFSGLLSLILACGCFAFIYFGYVKRVQVRYLTSFFAALILVLGLIFAGLSLTRPDNPLASIENNPLVLRALNWGTTVAMIRDNPWIGKGLDTFGFIYPAYQTGGANVVHHAHNTYLQLGVEMGILGTAVFLWFACWWFWRTLYVMSKTKKKDQAIWLGCLMVAGMAFFIHHAFDFEFYIPSATLAGFAVLAMAIGAQKKNRVYKIALKKSRRPLLTAVGFTVVLMVSLLLLVPFYGQMHFKKAQSLLKIAPYSADWTEEAAAEFKKAICLDPYNSEYHYLYGVLLVQRLSHKKVGIDEVQEAIRLSPQRHYYHFDLGMIYLVSGEREKGLAEIKKASQLYPLNEDYHQWLRIVYLQMGKRDLASQEERWIDKIQGEKGD
jgi:hypothetical protein